MRRLSTVFALLFAASSLYAAGCSAPYSEKHDEGSSESSTKGETVTNNEEPQAPAPAESAPSPAPEATAVDAGFDARPEGGFPRPIRPRDPIDQRY
jgi:hypothetical protein